ncbi:MAG: hypothetical protein AAB395_02145 [Patescibacteria group bacterium]
MVKTRSSTAKGKQKKRSIISIFWLIVDAIPLLLPLVIAIFGLVALILLLLGKLTSAYAFGIGITTSLLFMVWFIRIYSSLKYTENKERRVCNLAAILGVLLWIGINIPFTSQHVFTNRDPGVYSVTALHITNRDNLDLKTSVVYSGIEGVAGDSAGFSNNPKDTSQLPAQGVHLLPTLVGLTGRLTSETVMLRINVLFGAVALLAVYGFGRLIMRPRWALLATATFGLVFPLMYFSRDMYTEPLTSAFTFGGLALLWLAFTNRYKSLWFLAGIVLGATVLTRIDGYLTIAGVLMSVFIYLMLAKESHRIVAVKNASSIFAGLAISSIVGFLDIYILSHSYFLSEWSNIKPELILIGLTIVFGIIATAISWRTNVFKAIISFTKQYGLRIFTVLLVLISAGLASRPIWYVGYDQKPIINPATNLVEQVLQRDYSELTVNWLVWYIGPVAVILATLGLWLVVKRIIKNGQIQIIPFTLVFAGIGLVYMISPSIFPDQIWASRRFLPIAMPGCIILSAYALSWLYSKGKSKTLGVESKSLALILLAPLLLGPVFITASLYNTREAVWYGPLDAVCKKIPNNSAVLWVGTARTQLVEPTKALCGMPAQGYGVLFSTDDNISKQTLAKASVQARKAGYIPVVGLFGSEKGLLPESEQGSVADIYKYTNEKVESTTTTPPRMTSIGAESIALGVIKADGSISALKP